MTVALKVVAYLPAKHPAYCAVHDPSPGHCDCGARPVPLVTLENAQKAVEAAAQAERENTANQPEEI